MRWWAPPAGDIPDRAALTLEADDPIGMPS
jgi:hypothetical protein